MKKFYLFSLLLYFVAFCQNQTAAQSVLNPNDPVVEYDPSNPPAEPTYGQIGKWIRTKGVSWNSDSYKAYIYEGMCFRLKFPKTYNPTANDDKKYPLAIVFHGGGESGPITDNESQLYHGGQPYMDAVNNGIFDGYVLFPQSQGLWGNVSYERIIDIINYMVANNKTDPFCISVNGLSSGGQASWDMAINYTPYISTALPMSSISIGYKDSSIINKLKFTPIWNFQGALDGSPAPSTAEQVRDAMIAAGGNYKHTEYKNTAHNTWDSAFAEPDFFPFILRSYASNPWVLFGRSGFCDSTNINLTIGVAPGFDSYQWRNNGIVIQGSNRNSIQVTSLGTYDVRVKRGSIWSDWSYIPVVIRITPPTITPQIRISGLMSNLLPSGDGKNYVNLEVPDSGYTSYTWKEAGSDEIIGAQRIFTATHPGQYTASVSEKYGCTSIPSLPFTVISTTGLNAPDAATKLTAMPISATEIDLSWENNPHPKNNETCFEIYRSTKEDNNYTLVGKVPADSLFFKDIQLTPGNNYFYKVRAINNTDAAPISNIAFASTIADIVPPTAPGSLTVVYSTNSSMQLQWIKSTDNISVAKYLVYINGVKSYSTTDTAIFINSLQQGKTYSFYVKAIDSSGNYSPKSNLVSASAVLNGLFYKYYEGTWAKMPNFNGYLPKKTGVSKNLDLSVGLMPKQFAFLWQGYIYIPAAGNYKFRLTSDDGSQLWLNQYDQNSIPLIDNDHYSYLKSKTASIYLKKGSYPITVAFFQYKNAKGIQLEWSNQQIFGDADFHIINDQYFEYNYVPPGQSPAMPDSLKAKTIDYDRIKLSWADKSNNETAFQIYRSSRPNKDYNIIYTTDSNITQYTDTGLVFNTVYYYKINAVNNYNGTSGFTDYSVAKTLPIAIPKPASRMKATALSSSSIQFTWVDMDSNEVNYQILRSTNDSFHFKQVALLPPNTESFIDTGLYGNTIYYYKVQTIGRACLFSTDMPPVRTRTKNNLPVILKLTSVAIPANTQTVMSIMASDIDGDSLKFYTSQLPSFASLNDQGTDTAFLVFNPSLAQKGIYENIKIRVGEGYGGKDSTIFNLTVNDNYYPMLDSIGSYTMNEGETLNIPLNATDQNAGDSLSFAVTGSPAYAVEYLTNGKASLVLKPGYGASGTHIVQVVVSDGNGGSAIRQFQLRVNDVDPSQTVYIRFKENDSIGAPWNNVTTLNTTGFKDDLDRTTAVGLSMQTDWWRTWHEGPQTGNNSGIFPDPVLKDYYYFGVFGGPETVTSQLTGLDTSKRYQVSFYAGSNWIGAANNGSTVFTIGTQSTALPVQNNTTHTADFANIKPASDGTISFTMSKGNNTPAGYLNAVVIRYVYTDSTKPVAPTSLVAMSGGSKGVSLSWNDAAYNESAYQVYRSEKQSGPFVPIANSLPYNSTSYTDSSASGNTRYYYMVKAGNANGISDASNIADILTPNKAPVITPITDIIIKNNQQLTVNITAKDDATDHVKLTAAHLPSFVTFTDNGNGTGFFLINPSDGITGSFENIQLTASDNNDSSSTISFNIIVTDPNMQSIYVNFSDGSLAASPWNNFTAWPAGGTTLSNLIDDSGNNSSMAIKLISSFQGNFGNGMQTGDNNGIYPEAVIRTGIYEGSTKTDTIQLSGLSSGKRYNFIFFNSHDDGMKGNTKFAINGQTITLNATHNINTTAAINGVAPNANGTIIIKVTKVPGSDYAYLNSLIIQSYDKTQSLLVPSDLRVVSKTKTTAGLQWADRSFNETGFEVWRASDTTNANYTLIASVGSNITSYVDSGLLPGHTYYYTVRAIKTDTQSDYCSPIAVTTYTQAVYVNFTFINLAVGPWNNTAALPDIGIKWNNLLDDTGLPSSISMQETGSFAGIYSPGTITGNNSGVYPDKVLADDYGLFPGQISTMKLTGLNLNKKYDLTFFASAYTGGDINTSYTVNNKTVVLNASFNIDGAVTLHDVLPDENGEVLITIAPNSIYSQFGLIGALVIQEKEVVTDSIPVPPTFSTGEASTVSTSQATSLQAEKTADTGKENALTVYPNPFTYHFTLSLFSKKEDVVMVQLYDISGKVVFTQNLGRLPKGNNTVQLRPVNNLTGGIYMLKVLYKNSGKAEYIKLLRQ